MSAFFSVLIDFFLPTRRKCINFSIITGFSLNKTMPKIKQITFIVLLSMLMLSNSFAQTKLTDNQKKLIEKGTPKPLPQTPVAPKLTSDAKDENLKGKVKSVVYEAEYYMGPWMSEGRRIFSMTDFNETGNRLKYIAFFKEDWFIVEVYGYIDDTRVSSKQDNPSTENRNYCILRSFRVQINPNETCVTPINTNINTLTAN